MKLVTFEISTTAGIAQRIGALSHHGVIDLNAGYILYLMESLAPTQAYEKAATLLPPDMIGLLHSGTRGMEAARLTLEYIDSKLGQKPISGPEGERVVYEVTDVTIKAPVPRPNSLRDFITFEGHKSLSGRREVPPEWYQMPVYYKGNPDTVIGPDDIIPWPSYTDLLDYELEYGIYILKEGKNIPREKAEEYIAGYTIFNDISARDIQMQEMACRLGPAKGKDSCSIMGPCLVTPDEVDSGNMPMTARINGETWSEGNSGTSHWTWPQIIEFASMEETLYPGDFLGSGTVERGCGLELDRWIQPGDVIELEVKGLGTLRNRVGDKPPKRVFVP
jgi:2-keto-4-pentenoate hydratase/2-oxohepta-3-ene-1,7-dioic acid hydratase in catechol pathway